jgi:hypothetical protein
VGGIKFASLDCDDADLADYGIASWGVNKLSERHSRPFFLAVGFHKPHMPWNVPRKWYDLHPLDGIQLPSCREDDLEDIPVTGVKMAKPRGDHAAMQRTLEVDTLRRRLAGALRSRSGSLRMDESCRRDVDRTCSEGSRGLVSEGERA